MGETLLFVTQLLHALSFFCLEIYLDARAHNAT